MVNRPPWSGYGMADALSPLDLDPGLVVGARLSPIPEVGWKVIVVDGGQARGLRAMKGVRIQKGIPDAIQDWAGTSTR